RTNERGIEPENKHNFDRRRGEWGRENSGWRRKNSESCTCAGGNPARGVAPCRTSDQNLSPVQSISLSVEPKLKKGPCSGYAFIAVSWTSPRESPTMPWHEARQRQPRNQRPGTAALLRNTQPRMERSILQAFCLAAAGSLEAGNRVETHGELHR